ncbi:MAG: tRNA (adenosine(37)-N6)-threonylcarbamoyltransferase complex ATPase subunit type 1 TsaE [Defluviitaleaceae bacterium]|nr:tRNA (adenosine(37)-N6)-threonylcarbamoyltransferase complex ATPase subunit type 1 TsaE [Defluviitaleaceae bacterium]
MKYESFCTEDTLGLAYKLGKAAKSGDIYCLSGDLGAGKTVFSKGFARAMGYEGITSPTFNIMNEYNGGALPLYHFDLYRLKDESELETVGYEDYFYSDGVCLVEWAERAINFFPKNVFWVTISCDENYGSDYRELNIENYGDTYRELDIENTCD